MADSSFGVKKFNLVGSGTPKIESPNNINLNAINVAISTNATVGGTLGVGASVSLQSGSPGTAAGDFDIYYDNNAYLTTGSRGFVINSYNGSFAINGGSNSDFKFGISYLGTVSAGDFVPGSDNTYDLGITAINWRNLYLDGAANVGSLVASGTITGNGSGLTNLPAGNLTGTVADARISTLTASKLTGALPAIDGSNLTGITASTASSATKVNIQETNSGVRQVVFSAQNSTGNQDLYIDTNDDHLSYSPNLGRLYTPNYTGGSGGTSGSGLHHLSSTTISRDGMTVGADQSADAPAYLSSNCIRLDAQTGNLKSTGICTASYFYGDGSNLTGISGGGGSSDKISEGNTEVETIDTGSDGYIKFKTEGIERLRIKHDSTLLHVTTADAKGITQNSVGDFYIKNIANADRSSAGASILALHAQWDDKDVGAIKFRTGDDTTNKDDGHICFETSFSNNISEKMRIANNGKVGIGSDDPTQQLDVAGVLKVYGSDGPAYETVINPNSSGGTGETIIGKSNADLRIQAGSGNYQANRPNILLKNQSNDVIINAATTSGGKVGIGIAVPTEKLDVTGNIKASGTCTASHFYGDGSNLTSITASSVSGVSDDANFNTNGGDNTGLSASSTLIFGTSIGQKFGFTRWGSNQFVYLRTSNSSSYNYGTLKIRSDRGQTSSAQPIYATDSGASIIMAQYDGDVMLCSQTGNSNIGEVTGGYTNAGWHFDVTGMAKCCVDSGSSNPNCKMYRKVTGDAIQFIDRAGSSDVEIGSITMNVSSNSTAYNTSSDYRIKENVVNITGALAKINQLRPVNFNFIGKSVKLDGFLAHEVQAIVPYAVTGDKDAVKTVKDGDLSNDGSESDYVRIAALPTKEVPSLQQMDNSKLIGLLTAAVQELSAKNDALESRIAALES